MTPSVGRVVHYVPVPRWGIDTLAAHSLAIIANVSESGAVMLAVIDAWGLHMVHDVPYDATYTQPGTWHEPERV